MSTSKKKDFVSGVFEKELPKKAAAEEGEDDPTPDADTDEEPDDPKKKKAADVRNPDEAVMAEQAVQHYAKQCLDRVLQESRGALSSLNAWIDAQHESRFSETRFFEYLSTTFRDEIMRLCGGSRTPIGHQLGLKLDRVLKGAEREVDLHRLLQSLETAILDGVTSMRTTLPSALNKQWDTIRDKAYGGHRDFIPLLHRAGLPRPDLRADQMRRTLIARAELFRGRDERLDEKQKAADPNEEDAKRDELLLEEDLKRRPV